MEVTGRTNLSVRGEGIQLPPLKTPSMESRFTITKLSGIESAKVVPGGSLSPSANGLNFVAPTGATSQQDAKRPSHLRLVQ